MFTISVSPDVLRLRAKLSAIADRQMPFAASQAVNRLAKQAVTDVQKEMRRAFDRPTPFTLKAIASHGGTTATMQAIIFAREFAGKGTPGWKYLGPGVEGGERRVKRFERALGSKFGTTFTAIGRGAKLNEYGNISEGEIEKILSALGAAETQSGYRANRRTSVRIASRRPPGTFFIAHSRIDGSPLGIYQVISRGHVEPVIVFTRPPHYSARFHYREAIMTSIDRNAADFVRDALSRALATAR